MIEQVTFNTFRDRFRQYDRLENFSYEGAEALFNYLEELEEDLGTPIELDVIALCCDYSEYDEKEFIDAYGYLLEKEEGQDDETYLEALEDEVESNAPMFIRLDNGGYIVEHF